MMQNKERKPYPTLTDTQIITIETGFEWMTEDRCPFAWKLYFRLLEKHPRIRVPLSDAGFQNFRRTFLGAFQAFVSSLRTRRDLQAVLKESWAATVLEFSPRLQDDLFDELVKTFLEVLAECLEDAWSPAVEEAWRTGIREMRGELMLENNSQKFLSFFF